MAKKSAVAQTKESVAEVKSESTEIAVLSASQIAAFMAGGENKRGNSGFPRLTINKSAEDADGNIIMDAKGKAIGSGNFAISSLGLYQKEILFQPLEVRYQYQKYTKDFKIESRTTMFTSDDWNKDPVDSTGTIRCGRPDKTGMALLGPTEQGEVRKNIPCFMHVFGLAFFDGGDPQGTPVDFRVSGGKFSTVSEALGSVKNIRNNLFRLRLVKDSKGNNVFFSVVMELVSDKTPAVTAHTIETLNSFLDYISSENEKVYDSYKNNLNKKIMNQGAKQFMADVMEADYTEIEPDLLDDEAPF